MSADVITFVVFGVMLYFALGLVTYAISMTEEEFADVTVKPFFLLCWPIVWVVCTVGVVWGVVTGLISWFRED